VAYGSGPEQAAMGEPSKRSPRYFTPRGTSKMCKRMSPPASASGLDGLPIGDKHGKENADDLKFASLYPREVVERCIQNLESANKEVTSFFDSIHIISSIVLFCRSFCEGNRIEYHDQLLLD
jgi:hypothetical protein